LEGDGTLVVWWEVPSQSPLHITNFGSLLAIIGRDRTKEVGTFVWFYWIKYDITKENKRVGLLISLSKEKPEFQVALWE
jgi:hypothetical protein